MGIFKLNGIDYMGGGGGGTTVVPNPSGTPTDDLDTVSIDGVIYNIPGSGGGGVSFDEDILFNTQTAVSSGSSIQLTSSIFDYDLIIIDTSTSSYTDWREHIFMDVSQITLNTEYTRMILRTSSETYGLRYKFTANNTIYAWGDGSRDMIIYKITGVKFNGSGGGSGSGYSETSLWTGPETPSTSGTTITLNDNLSDYDMIYVNAHHGSYTNEEGSILIAVSSLTVGGNYIYTIYDYDKLYICFEYSSNTQLLIKTANSNNPTTYTEIVGIKFGSGGGSSSGGTQYDTTEQVIGTWVDGRDVYRKLVPVNATWQNLTSGTYYSFAYLENWVKEIDYVTNAIAVSSEQYYANMMQISVQTDKGNGIAVAYCNNPFAGAYSSMYIDYVILEYVKAIPSTP